MGLGNRFIYYRKIRGLKQKEAAKLIGVKPYILANYENDRSEPNITILKRMSKVYRVTIDRLVGNIKIEDVEEEPTFNSVDLNDIETKVKEILEVINRNK